MSEEQQQPNSSSNVRKFAFIVINFFLSSIFLSKQMKEPQATSSLETADQAQSLPPYLILKTCDIDGMKIEFIYKEKSYKMDSDDGDDTSTVCAEDAEAAEERLKEILGIDEGQESFFPEACDDKKLEPIVEEIPVNDEAEEGYEGAAGLWAKDYQLPCFKTGPTKSFQQQNYDFPSSLLQHSWLQQSSFRDTPPMIINHCKMPETGSTFDAIMKTADESLVFTKERADCGMCKRPVDVGRGVVLKDCLHTFCRRCLVHSIENNQNAMMMCPSKQVCCESEVRDDEIKALLTPEAYEKFVHEQLVKMEIFDLAELHETYDFVENKRDFRCDICMKDIKSGEGIVLKSCLHQYCKPCLGQYIQTSDEVEVSCPFRGEDGSKCIGFIMDSELRSLVTIDIYLGFLNKSLATAEAANPNAYHCKTPDCPAWVEIDCEVEGFQCPACQRDNCVKCKAVHQGVSCDDYQDMMHGDDRRSRENAATENQVRGLIASKHAQPCPRCGIITQRIDGCRHMTCTKCKHEFQWMGN